MGVGMNVIRVGRRPWAAFAGTQLSGEKQIAMMG